MRFRLSDSKIQIHVETKPAGRLKLVFCQACFWAMLVGSIAVSRVWLGGSFLVEVLATIFSVIALVQIAKRFTGREITMSVRDVDAWISAGSPMDVKEWLAARSANVVNPTESVTL